MYTKMDSRMKERNCVDKYRSKCKKKRSGFYGYKAENVTTTETQSESMHMQDGEEPILEFCGKNREMICCRRCRKCKTINKIVPMAGNSNSSLLNIMICLPCCLQ